MKPYSRARFFAFLHPARDAAGTGYQILQAKIGMGSGHIFGVGLGRGVQKIFYLPEAHTDMMLANIGEELGLIGVAAVIGAYALFAYAGLDIAVRCRDPFGKRLAAGLTVLVCGQAAVNILAVMGAAPLTGIPLPFLSYGGSSLVVLLAGVGILLNIAQRGSAAAASVSDRSRGTAGHVLPALAVADALTSRGVHVTFAGSPDRVEARLVPEAGYELDTFRIAGLPRRPSVELARALLLAGSAPRACRRILRRRRPDVVLGARRLRRRPDGVRRFDASHPGGADRGRCAPRPREPARGAVRETALPRVSTRDALAPEVTRRRPADASRARPVSQAEAREIFELPQDGPGARRVRRARRREGAERARRRHVGRGGPAILHQTGRRDYELVRAPRDGAPTTACSPRRSASAPRSPPCDLVLARRARRCGRSPPRAGRRSSCRTRSRPATTRR